MEDENLRNALRPGPDCLLLDRLGRYADGVLSDGDRAADESHIATCPNCQAELTLLHAFAASPVRDDEADIVRAGVEQLRRRESEIFRSGQRDDQSLRRWFSLGKLRPALAMAAVLLAIVGGYYITNPAAPRLPTDVGSGSEATRSMGITVLEPVGDQTAVPGRLRWQPVSGASRYHVRLTEVDRHEIWSGDTTESAVDLPADIRAQISPAKSLIWQVAAYGSSATPIAESDPQRFRYKP
jgi:Putative zinc-finger